MKFENIKKGDIVYIKYKVGGMGGFHSSTYGEFWLPKEVTNTTAKFFDVGKRRFNKECGSERASGYGRKSARNLGDVIYGKEVKDQTEEYAKATKLLHKLEKARSLMLRYHVDHKIWSEEDLDALTELLVKNKPSK